MFSAPALACARAVSADIGANVPPTSALYLTDIFAKFEVRSSYYEWLQQCIQTVQNFNPYGPIAIEGEGMHSFAKVKTMEDLQLWCTIQKTTFKQHQVYNCIEDILHIWEELISWNIIEGFKQPLRFENDVVAADSEFSMLFNILTAVKNTLQVHLHIREAEVIVLCPAPNVVWLALHIQTMDGDVEVVAVEIVRSTIYPEVIHPDAIKLLRLLSPSSLIAGTILSDLPKGINPTDSLLIVEMPMYSLGTGIVLPVPPAMIGAKDAMLATLVGSLVFQRVLFSDNPYVDIGVAYNSLTGRLAIDEECASVGWFDVCAFHLLQKHAREWTPDRHKSFVRSIAFASGAIKPVANMWIDETWKLPTTRIRLFVDETSRCSHPVLINGTEYLVDEFFMVNRCHPILGSYADYFILVCAHTHMGTMMWLLSYMYRKGSASIRETVRKLHPLLTRVSTRRISSAYDPDKESAEEAIMRVMDKVSIDWGVDKEMIDKFEKSG